MKTTLRSPLPRAALGCTLLLAVTVACESGRVPVPEHPQMEKSAASVRAERRAYDGAPPVPPHEDFGMECTNCHDMEGIEVPDIGYAPPVPHAMSGERSGEFSRCRQCHVFQQSETVRVANSFTGLRQDLRHGTRAFEGAPPTIPHDILMRENCMACHTGPAAREEIRTSHPERTRCTQCHVAQQATTTFARE